MPKSIESLVSFNSGEWSPTLTARVDQQKYRSACLQLRNMIALKTGPAVRRPGTQFMAPCKVIPGGTYCARMEDFQFEDNTKFALEWGHHYVRFYSNGGQVQVDPAEQVFWISTTAYTPGQWVQHSGVAYLNILAVSAKVPPFSNPPPASDPTHWSAQTIYEVTTPYSALVGSGVVTDTDVYRLQFCPINDVIYISHNNYPRAKLSRFADTNWIYQVVEDITPPLLDQNATDTTIAASAASGVTNLTASAPAWTTETFYDIGDSVLEGGQIYECLVPHISGLFATDLSNNYWELAPVFNALHVGSFWELSYLRNSAYVEYDGVAATGFAAGTSATITAFGAWEVHTYGVWNADIQIQASADGGITWQTVRSTTGRGDRNVDIQGTAAKAQLYRIVVSNVAVPTTPGPTNPRIVFECVDAFLHGLVQITAVADAYHATAKTVTQLTVADAWISGFAYAAGDRVGYNGVNYLALNAVTSSTAPPSDPTNWSADGWPTIYWSEGAWSAYRGYPRATTCFEQKVWCGYTDFEPQRIWGTQTDDLENWDLGDQTLATDGVAFDLDAVGDGGIVWLQTQDTLFVGMGQAEWIIGPSDSTTALGPSNISAHRQSRWGSCPYIPALVVGDALVFAQRQAFSLRQMLFSIATNKYMSQDLTALSEQILNGGALQLAYQKQGSKNGFVWATTANGELVAMTYELDQEIFGWSRHYTGLGLDIGFESVCSIQGSGTADDEVYVVVNRFIANQNVRYVERLNPVNWQTVIPNTGGTPGYSADKNQAFYVDSGLTFTNPTSNVFPGFAYLAGRDLSVCINGLDYGLVVNSQKPPTLIAGHTYQITLVGNTDWVSIGAASNNIGVTFVATGPGSGTGAASGDLTVPAFDPSDYTDTVIVSIGLPFTSTVQPMNLDSDVHVGVTQGIKKRISGLYIYLLNTLALKVWDGSYKNDGTTQSRVTEVIFRTTEDGTGEVPLFSGIKSVRDFGGDIGRTIPVIMYTDGNLPLTVLGVAIDYGIVGST